MKKLCAFTQITLDGYYASSDGTLAWAHRGSAGDPEFQAFVADNAKGGGVLLFGRRTYEMMLAYWPTPLALEQNRTVAEGMNRMPKFVASRTLERPEWSNTEVLSGELVPAVEKLKRESEADITILGSASLVTALSDARLIDEYQLVVLPTALGAGSTLFSGLARPLDMKLERSRTFKSGIIVSSYTPAR
jgi:dihydrofolate reductase